MHTDRFIHRLSSPVEIQRTAPVLSLFLSTIVFSGGDPESSSCCSFFLFGSSAQGLDPLLLPPRRLYPPFKVLHQADKLDPDTGSIPWSAAKSLGKYLLMLLHIWYFWLYWSSTFLVHLCTHLHWSLSTFFFSSQQVSRSDYSIYHFYSASYSL